MNRNPVAKNAAKFCHARVFDNKKQYKRKLKHKNSD